MRQSWALILLLLPAYGQQPEPAPETKIKVEVRRVPVDVIVTDAKGNPIGDLKKDDFTVLEDKKPQEITSFNLERVSSNIPAKKLPLVPDGFLSNALVADASASDLTVILFDELNTRFADAAYARSQMEKLLSHPSLKGHPVSLLLLNSELLTLHDFTDDPRELLLAFKRHTPFLPILAEDEYSGFKINPNDVPPSVAREALMGERQYQELFGRFNAVNRAEITLGAMRNLAESLRERPGRKRVLWFSAGFPIAFDEASLSRNSSMIPYQMAGPRHIEIGAGNVARADQRAGGRVPGRCPGIDQRLPALVAGASDVHRSIQYIRGLRGDADHRRADRRTIDSRTE